MRHLTSANLFDGWTESIMKPLDNGKVIAFGHVTEEKDLHGGDPTYIWFCAVSSMDANRTYYRSKTSDEDDNIRGEYYDYGSAMTDMRAALEELIMQYLAWGI